MASARQSGSSPKSGSAGAAVSVQAVAKRYGRVPAVRGVSLEAKAGEFLSLLGPSGSGKTTVLMMIAGFEIPDAGSISIAGREVTHVPANRRDVGMVFQRYALFPHMTVADNIGFPLRMRRMPKRDIAARVEEALALVRLEGYGGRLPVQLSGGQQQRVALARAVVFRPPVLLMDEPLAALDKKLRQAMQLEVRRLQRQLGLTVLYVTHDQEEALTMSDRIAVLNEGQLEQVGRPEDLYERPASAFVAEFIGETNFFGGEVVSLDGQECSVRLTSNSIVRARTPAAGLAVGQPVRLAVRPERLSLDPGGVGVDGIVAERIYAGAVVTYVIATSDQLNVMVRGAAAGGDRAIGDRVRISWQPQNARIYPARANTP
jgi:spermidine/putrescine ABC transporter ATP-binding subunit